MQHYDFIVFENYRQAQHHKIDVLLIAHLLQHAGMKVGLLDIYHEDKGVEIEGVPVIHHDVPIPVVLVDIRPKNPMKRIAHRLNYFRQQYSYMKAVRDKVKDMADGFYCGSYHVDMDSAWFELEKPCYWWGLRSNRFQLTKEHFDADKFTFVRIPHLRRRFLRNPYQKFFVSNEIIKDEFLKLGVPENRMVIREERVIEKLGESGFDKLSPQFSFLTIGQIRPQKRVEKSVASFLALKESNVQFRIVGRCSEEYEKIIASATGNSKKIERKSGFLQYEDFLNYFRQSHFVVFADEPIKGTVTNGTMLEALINYRPIIAPNYDPYRYYVEKYHIGILYDPNKEGDQTRAMQEAMSKGVASFEKPINLYLQTILFDRVSRQLSEQIQNRG